MKIIGGAIYAAGSFSGTVDLDPGPGIFKVTRGGMLLIKMDTAGNFIWGKPIRASFNSFAVDKASNLYITGGFKDTVDFDPGPGVNELTPTPWSPAFPLSNNTTDIFVAKYDSAGNLAWAHSFGNHYDDAGRGVAADRFGNVFVSGTYRRYTWKDTVDFDPGPGVSTLSEYGNLFVLKLRKNGDFAWVRNAGGRPYCDRRFR